jgi:CheY-like chemotaxis protein
MITLLLKSRGWRTETVGSGRDALRKWEEDRFDLILMDLQMPEMNGFEATLAIRGREAAGDRHTCIVGLTAHAGREIREECLKSGMDMVLIKPVRMEELFSAIEGCLSDRKV